MSTGLQPEHWKQFLKLAAQRHGILIEEAQLEESRLPYASAPLRW